MKAPIRAALLLLVVGLVVHMASNGMDAPTDDGARRLLASPAPTSVPEAPATHPGSTADPGPQPVRDSGRTAGGAASVRIVAVVVNDTGGTLQAADLGLLLNGSRVASGSTSSLEPGPHRVAYDRADGYAVTFGGDCAADGSLALAPGAAVTCALTYDDQPATLEVTVIVVNDDHGTRGVSDFGVALDKGRIPPNQSLTVPAGAHQVHQGADESYTTTIGGDCTGDGSVSLLPGEKKICTVRNDDKVV